MAYHLAGTCPIGGIIAWDKSLGGVTPAMTDEYVEANGQSLSDANSPLNGQTMPPLNSTTMPRFLRGSQTSGSTNTYETHCHSKGVQTTAMNQLMASECYLAQNSYKWTKMDTIPLFNEQVYLVRVK
jgi:hypothetical protein